MLSDLAGDSMRLSESGSPTVNPFKLDAIICRIIFFLNFLLYEIFKEKELRYKLTPIQTQTKAKPHTNLHPLKPNKHTNLQDNFFFFILFLFPFICNL